VNGPRQRHEPASLEIPDLDLPLPKASASQANLPAVAASRSGERKAIVIGGGLSMLPDAPPLDLDLTSPISGERALRGAPYEVAGRAGFEMDSELPKLAGITVAPEGRGNWPSGLSENRAALSFDFTEVERLANFGSPFSIGPLNVLYLLRVFVQRRRLRRELLRLEAELAQAESARDDLLAELASEKRPELEGSESFRRLLAPLAELDSEGRQHDQQRFAHAAEQDAEMRRLEAELALLTPRLDAEKRAQSELASVKAEREQNRNRLEARYKRAAIELRALEQRGDSQGLAAIREQQEALRPQIEKAKLAYDATLAEHDVHVRAERELRYQIGEIERKKCSVAGRFEKRRRENDKTFGATLARRTRLLADVGRAVLAARGGVSVSPELIARLRGADDAVAKALRASEIRVRAFDAGDREKLSAGKTWLVGVMSALIALVGYRLFA
jgi:hypothetical protein